MVRKKVPSELEQAEIKLESLLERRDALNAEAAALRQDRDLLNGRKREISAGMRALRDERDAFVREMRAHRDRRNELQGKAKELIELKRQVRTQVKGSIRGEVERIRRDVKALEMKQQTSSLKLDEENALLDDIRAKLKELKGLEGLRDEQERITKEVKDLDGSIDDLFKVADKEHELVVKLNEEARERHEKFVALAQEMRPLIEEADKKHGEFLKARERADEFHQKAAEMRERVLGIRDAQRAEIREARTLLRHQNQTVRKELLDERKLERAADEALQLLLKKGRVEMKG